MGKNILNYIFLNRKKKIKNKFSENIKLIIGLGNVGVEYLKTRHNAGFLAIDEIIDCLGVKLNYSNFNGNFFKGRIEDQNIILAKPNTYINNSGLFINDIIKYYKIDIKNILVICDCAQIPIGQFKLSKKIGSSHHNGLRNIKLILKTDEINHIRIGIGPKKDERGGDFWLKKYVLGDFSHKEIAIIEKINKVIVHIFKDFLSKDFENLQNTYNQKISQ